MPNQPNSRNAPPRFGTPGVSITAARGPQGIQGVPGPMISPIESDPEPSLIPGPQGIPGLIGVQGTPGIAVFSTDGLDGQEFLIPGVPGPQGREGLVGPAGPPGLPMEPDSPEEPIMIPGTQGPAGAGNPAVGYALLGLPSGYPVNNVAPGAQTLTLPVVAAGVGGAIAIPIEVPSQMNLDSYLIWQTATANLRTAEFRLYLDVGVVTANFVAGSDGTTSFTPAAADLRTLTPSGNPAMPIGVYWLVIRNTSTVQTFLIGRTAGGTFAFTRGGWRQKNIAALGATLDLSTGWSSNGANAPVSAAIQGRALGETNPS